MGRPEDENLPEVVPNQPAPLPEVVPDSSPEAVAAQQRFFVEQGKYPAYFDNAPKLPHEQDTQGQYGAYGQQWAGTGDPASAVSPNSSVPWQPFPPGGDDQTHVGSEPEPERRICGLRRRLFIIVAVIIAVVVIAAAVGGGVGGSMKAREGSGASEAVESGATSSSISPSGTSSTPTTSSPSSTSSTSSAPSPTISFLNNQTDPRPGFAFQGFSEKNFEGNATAILRDEGFHDLGLNAWSYVWLPNNTDCCVTFCANQTTSTGYRCDMWHRNASSSSFSRVSLWCGRNTNIEAREKCS
ncbi:hypothetical protein VTK56DRAFT_849 [Thermocarpiscus australiensis]